jgi:hypothetical protein
MNVYRLLKLTAVVAVAIGLAPHAHAFSGCTSNSLSGSYGLQFSGVLTPEGLGGVGGAPTPDKVVAQIRAEAPGTTNVVAGFARFLLDGGGNLIGNAAVTVNGAWSEGPMSGSYTVADDCNASFTLTDSTGATQHFDAVIVNSGDGAMLRQSDRGIGVSGFMKRTRNSCQSSDIGGSFGFRASGTVAAGQFSSIGNMFLGPDGLVTLLESRFAGGTSSIALSGGYITVSPDCTVTLTLAAVTDGAIATYRGILVNNLKELLLVRSDDGTSVSGSISVQ